MREIDEEIWHAYERDLKARNLSRDTTDNYRFTVGKLSDALPRGLLEATPRQVSGWLAGLAGEHAPASVGTWFRRVRTFYAWCARMEYLDGPDPVAKLRPPREGSRVIPLPDPADIAAVLEACRGKGFRDRRDLAIMRLMLETGTPRAAAIAALRRDQVDLRRDQVTFTDKGRKERVIPVGARAAHALTLWLRARAGHPRAGQLPQLFLGKRGPMTRDGIYQVLEYRCGQAGVPVISPHKWRHFTADRWYEAGGSEGDAMALYGWSSPAMAHRYAAAHAARRAQDHAREAALGDAI
jgi:integrase